MKRIIVIIFILFISLFNINAKFMKKEKKDALKFSLKIIESYFNKNHDFFYSILKDKLYILEDDVKIDVNDNVKTQLYGSISRSMNRIIKKGYTFSNYTGLYIPEIYSKKEFEKKFDFIKRIKSYKPDDKDYLFVGYKTKNDKKGFMWDDILVFIVRKTDDGWILIAISG